MNATTSLRERLAALLALLGVALGAIGAHALREHLSTTPNGLESWKTAAFYHLTHAIVLYFLASKQCPRSWWLLFSGILLFSGSLYAHSLTQMKFLVFLTPIGGMFFLLGWAGLVVRKSK